MPNNFTKTQIITVFLTTIFFIWEYFVIQWEKTLPENDPVIRVDLVIMLPALLGITAMSIIQDMRNFSLKITTITMFSVLFILLVSVGLGAHRSLFINLANNINPVSQQFPNNQTHSKKKGSSKNTAGKLMNINDPNHLPDFNKLIWKKVEEEDLKTTIENYISKNGDSESVSFYKVASVDLNRDSIIDKIVVLEGDYWCGTGGCTIIIVTKIGCKYTVMGKEAGPTYDVAISPHRTGEWSNLYLLFGDGGGINYYRIYAFKNGSYDFENPLENN